MVAVAAAAAASGAPMAGKDIFLLFDGTWNDIEFGDSDTNVVRLYELMAKTVARRAAAATDAAAEAARCDAIGADPEWTPPTVKHPQAPAGPAVAAVPETPKPKPVPDKVHSYRDPVSNRQNIVFYSRGVGTGASDRFRGGAFGGGLSRYVLRGYTFLSYHYDPGDRIFIFGFSRGSFTARSLTGYIAAAGLLRRDQCTPELADRAWQYYRTHPDDRLPGEWVKLGQYMHPRTPEETVPGGDPVMHIACLAVFDTVGALGIPTTAFSKFNRDKYAFHGVELSSITSVNLQALAIDEQRPPFEAAVWRRPRFKHFETCTEQVWFAGVHADVGGGYIDEMDVRSPPRGARLDDFSLDWMIQRLRHHFPRFPVDPQDWPALVPDVAHAVQHNSRDKIYLALPHAHRMIGNANDPRFAGLQRWRHRQVCRDRHAEPYCEMVHISALERLAMPGYRPQNLIAILPAIAATYRSEKLPASSGLQIVKWDGTILRPHKPADCTEALRLVAAAQQHAAP